MQSFFNYSDFMRFLSDAAEHYEKSAPPVEQWIDDLYRRVDCNPADVSLLEVTKASTLLEDGTWMQPNYAANMVYHLLDRLGRDTTGQAGF